jgi:hypothetical protein
MAWLDEHPNDDSREPRNLRGARSPDAAAPGLTNTFSAPRL